jgi:hypothetical protein
MINVWHIRKAPKGAQYIGRESGGYARSPYCNPQPMNPPGNRAQSREEALIDFALYWFAPEQKNLRRMAMDLPNDIMCWCAPKWCHGHIIAGYVEWAKRNWYERALRDYDSFNPKNW